MLGWDPGVHHPAFKVCSPFSCFSPVPWFLLDEDPSIQQKVLWQVSYCEKRCGTRSARNSTEHFPDPQFGCSTLVSSQFKSQDQSKESISRFLLQHSYSCELLQVVINRRLLNNADLNQENILHGVFSGICLSHVYHQGISWLWLKIWLMLCKCQKMDEGRKESMWRGFGYSCTPMHC